jgi:hypothetical protein
MTAIHTVKPTEKDGRSFVNRKTNDTGKEKTKTEELNAKKRKQIYR